MISKSYKILAILLLILGIAHCTMVFVYFDSLTAEALFSLGTGIGVFFLGLLRPKSYRPYYLQQQLLQIVFKPCMG